MTLDGVNLQIPGGQLQVLDGLTLADGSTVQLDSTIYSPQGVPQLYFNGTQSLSGNGQVQFAGDYYTGNINVSNALTIGSQVTVETDGFGGYVTDSGNGSIINQGTIQANGGQTLSVNPALTNQGLLQASNDGTLSVGPGYLQSSGSTVLQGGTLSANGTIQIQGGDLDGSGIIQADVSNAGNVRPGGTGAAGSLQIQGNYTQTGAGNLDVEIGGTTAGTQFDQLNVTGVASLDGTLNASTINNYVWPSADCFSRC